MEGWGGRGVGVGVEGWGVEVGGVGGWRLKSSHANFILAWLPSNSSKLITD